MGQEALQRHATGMSFREANAGPGLDMQMSSAGFQQDIKVDWTNGLIFGGNQNNCGTWMDKMGESDRANSKGVPGTPRDGSAIEIAGLLYSTLVWISKLHNEGKYKYAGVSTTAPDLKVITFADWASPSRPTSKGATTYLSMPRTTRITTSIPRLSTVVVSTRTYTRAARNTKTISCAPTSPSQ